MPGNHLKMGGFNCERPFFAGGGRLENFHKGNLPALNPTDARGQEGLSPPRKPAASRGSQPTAVRPAGICQSPWRAKKRDADRRV